MKGYTIQHSIELLEKQAGSGSGGASTAAQVSFDNTGTDLVATNVQSAIAEVETNVINKGFGEVTADTDLSNFQAVSDAYSINFDGLAVIGVLASDSAVRISVNNSDGAFYSYANAVGASGSLTIPVKTGDTLTITAITNCSISRINKYPLTVPTANTRKSKKK